MRLAIMGGTLDPVHNGHLEIAREVRKRCRLDGIMLLPAGDPPHKRRRTDRMDRLAMAKLAAQHQPDMSVSDIEVMREGTTFTVDTLTELHRVQPEVEWFYIIGADTVNVLDKWRNFETVAGLCEFIAVGRPGYEAGVVMASAERLREQFGAKIHFLDVSGPDISSTQVRERAALNLPLDGLVPDEVAAYIRDRGLYLCDYSWDDLEQKLKGMIKPSRFRHTMGVAETAVHLAELWGEDPQRARLAAMLHDCAKSMSNEDMIALILDAGLDVDEDELALHPVIHAPAGAVVAQREFGVKDPQILSAIRNHTLGGPGMTDLDRLIYIADFIEPNRKSFPGLDDVRKLAETDLHKSVARCAELTSEYALSQGGKTHIRSEQMLNEL